MRGRGTAEAVRSESVNVPVVVLGFLILVVDGIDQATTAVTVPRLALDWGVPPSAFTLPVVATNLGIVVGYMIGGRVAARIRNAPTLYAGLAVVVVGSAASALVLGAESVPLLTLARVVAGVGIGVVLPISIAVTTSLNPDTAKERITVVMALGLIAGVGVGGLVGGALLSWWGASGIFWVAAFITVIIGLVATTVLPWHDVGLRAPHGGTTVPGPGPGHEPGETGRVRDLLAHGSATTTVLLWGFAFLVFITVHLLTSWTPAILVMYRFDPTSAPIGLAYLSLGAALGGLALVWLVARWSVGRAMIAAAVIAFVFLCLIGLAGWGGQVLLLLLVGAGVGTGGCQVAMLAMAVSMYSPAARPVGVGYAAAAGRVGSIVGPLVGGALLATSFGPSVVILIASVPMVIAFLVAIALSRRPAAGGAAAQRRPRLRPRIRARP